MWVGLMICIVLYGHVESTTQLHSVTIWMIAFRVTVFLKSR
jgi:hypothetical protein